MLQVKNITKSYTTGDFTQSALAGVSLGFRKSEFVAVLGASGSGKTTFLNIIGGLDRYDSGDLVINGKSTKSFKDKEWDAYRNNSVGFIFQSYNLINHLSIMSNVELGMTLSGVSVKEKQRKAKEALERVGLKDHMHKKPNQLSGGQMQRVAIARALANDPDIILADEPTGALDTQTSQQIMELIREIAKDKLVIMVTHNPDLADTYADRVIKFRDGKVIEDSNTFTETEEDKDYKLKKTSMGFFTALKLSANNIATKKGRTALTAFASSIGIIGIALILSLSNGFNKQIESFEADTLSGFPVVVSQTSTNMDIEEMQQMGSRDAENTRVEYPKDKVLYPYDITKNSIIHANDITDDYVNYVKKIDSDLLAGVTYTRVVNMPLLHKTDKEVKMVDTSSLNFSAYPNTLNVEQQGYLETNYDVLYGKLPQKMTDLVLIVDKYNRLDVTMLKQLGLDAKAEEIELKDIVGMQFKVVHNDEMYKKNGDYYIMNAAKDGLKALYDHENNITLNITGVIRTKETTKLQVLSSGIAYSDALTEAFIENAQDSKIVKAQEKADYNVMTGEAFPTGEEEKAPLGQMSGMGMMSGSGGTAVATKSQVLASIGATATPYAITLYPKDFTSKEKVTDYLDQWNTDKEDDNKVVYTDAAADIISLSGGIMDGITLVLIAFAAVSLVVSLIMIGIITYISVLERTKEIGVLRALGARKKDISRVFNAETFIVGTLSGLLGIAIAYLLTFPVNVILEQATELVNVAQLNPLHALILVIISVLLTMLGGMIPAKIASKKDPVEALRSE